MVVKSGRVGGRFGTVVSDTVAVCVSHQVNVVKDLGGAVHLAQDDDHLVVDELLELAQVARHLHLQLGADLPGEHVTFNNRRQPLLLTGSTRVIRSQRGNGFWRSTPMDRHNR